MCIRDRTIRAAVVTILFSKSKYFKFIKFRLGHVKIMPGHKMEKQILSKVMNDLKEGREIKDTMSCKRIYLTKSIEDYQVLNSTGYWDQ